MMDRQTLFGVEEEREPAARERVSGPVAAVGLEDSLDKLLDYSIPSKLLTRIAGGQRVKVPLGKRNRPVSGDVVAIKEGSEDPGGKDLIEIEAEADVNWMEEGSGVRVQGSGEEKDVVVPELNEDQRRVYDDLLPRVVGGGFSVNLLFGVTGSGKTEIYLRCIEEVVERGRQAIVLAPELALTPQTVRRFTARFARVALLHSRLSASQRHRIWQH